MKTSLLILLLLLSGCNRNQKEVANHNEKDRWIDQAQNVEIIRDDFGIPHVYGKTDADAVFGLLYAQCEDDFNRVERNYIWAIGRLAEIEGEKALYSDLRARLFMTRKEAQEKFDQSPPWLQKLCVAFADGINYYLYTHPEVRPKLLKRFEPWMPFYFSEGSIGGDIERVSTKKIQQFYDKDLENSLGTLYDGNLRLNYNDLQGSNGIALSGELTQSGNSMLLINPHTSFFFRGEVHMVSDEGLNAYGAVTWGQFFIYQGFNSKTGWMHTSTGTDIIDEFEESIIKDKEGLRYHYGSEKRNVEAYPVNLKYTTTSGVKEKGFTIYRTHHGPITHSNENKWVSTALMWKPIQALEQSFQRTKQSNHSSFREMMNMRTNSSNNTVFADSEGNIAYYHGNFIPKRSDTFDYSKPVDGSDPEADWQGLHEVDENILIVNPSTGWIQNCNSTPFTAAGEESPKPNNYPAYMTSFPENFRGIHAISLLKETDDLSLDGFIDLAYDPYLPGADQLVSGLLTATSSIKDPDSKIIEPIEVLKKWDFEVSSDAVAMTLCQYYLNAYKNSNHSPFSRRNFIKMIEYMSKTSSYEERVQVFEKALDNLYDDFGKWDVAWGEYNRYQRINGDIVQKFNDSLASVPIGLAAGYWGALASFGTRHGANTKRVYGVGGNSFVAVVEFGDKVKAKSLLAGGQSGDPDSPHFSDQVTNYAKGKFKTVAYYKEDVKSRAVVTYRPGQKVDK